MTEQVTNERIAEIRARLSNITPPPWAWESIADKSNEFAVGTAFDAQGTQLLGRLPEGEWVEDTIIERRGLIGMNESGHARFADADFIAHAPNDIRDLLLALDAATASQEALLKRAKALSLDDAVKFAEAGESEIGERLRWFQIVAALQIDLIAAEAELARLRAQAKAVREHIADCFGCQQRGVCEEAESMLQPLPAPPDTEGA